MIALTQPASSLSELKRRVGASALVLVGADGRPAFHEIPEGALLEPFAIMSATLLGAAVTIHEEMHLAPPDQVVIEGEGSKTIIVRTGRDAALVVVVDEAADTSKVLATIRTYVPAPPA